MDSHLHLSCGIFIANFLHVVFYSTVRYWPKKFKNISKDKKLKEKIKTNIKILFFCLIKSLEYSFNVNLKLFAFYLKRSFIVIKNPYEQMINPYATKSNSEEGFESLLKFKTKYVWSATSKQTIEQSIFLSFSTFRILNTFL